MHGARDRGQGEDMKTGCGQDICLCATLACRCACAACKAKPTPESERGDILRERCAQSIEVFLRAFGQQKNIPFIQGLHKRFMQGERAESVVMNPRPPRIHGHKAGLLIVDDCEAATKESLSWDGGAYED